MHVAAYIETHPGSPPTVKQHLAAIRALFDFLVRHGVLPHNPAALVGAVTGMCVRDYHHVGRRSRIRLLEKGGKHHEAPAHHALQAHVDANLASAELQEPTPPLFQTVTRQRALGIRAMTPRDVQRMLARRARQARVAGSFSPHSFHATGITIYLGNGGTVEHAQRIAAHASPRTTKMYDHTDDRVVLDEVERILVQLAWASHHLSPGGIHLATPTAQLGARGGIQRLAGGPAAWRWSLAPRGRRGSEPAARQGSPKRGARKPRDGWRRRSRPAIVPTTARHSLLLISQEVHSAGHHLSHVHLAGRLRRRAGAEPGEPTREARAGAARLAHG